MNASITPHLMAVFDTLEGVHAPAPSFETQLTTAALEVARSQHMEFSETAVRSAVHQHVLLSVADGSGTALTPAAPRAFDFGWRRPKNEVEHARRLGKGSRWRAFLRARAARGIGGNLIFNGLISGLPTAMLAFALMPSSLFWVTPMMFGVSFFLGFLFIDELLRPWLDAHENELADYQAREHEMKEWARVPEAKRYVRACLLSERPVLMEGDYVQISALMAADRAASEAQKTKAVEHERQVALNTLFLTGSNEAD